MNNEPSAQATLESVDIWTVFVKGHAPQRFFSTIDFAKVWIDGCKERARRSEWWLPIEFKDEEGNTLAAYTAESIMCVIRGTVKVDPNQQGKVGT